MFIVWLRKAQKLYARYLHIIEYDTCAFDNWVYVNDISVSSDMANFTALYDMIDVAKRYRAEMRNGNAVAYINESYKHNARPFKCFYKSV